jgi:hypothetical protein
VDDCPEVGAVDVGFEEIGGAAVRRRIHVSERRTDEQPRTNCRHEEPELVTRGW